MSKRVNFEGKTYMFPDDATDEEISSSLTSSTPHQTAGTGPTGPRLKGTPSGFDNSFMGTLSGDVAGLPIAAYNVVRHPINTFAGTMEGLANLPSDLVTDISQGNFGKLGARALEMGLTAPGLGSMAEEAGLRSPVALGPSRFVEPISSMLMRRAEPIMPLPLKMASRMVREAMSEEPTRAGLLRRLELRSPITPPTRVPLHEQAGITITPRNDYSPIEPIRGQLPSGRTVGPTAPAPIASRAPIWQGLPDVPKSPLPEVQSITPPVKPPAPAVAPVTVAPAPEGAISIPPVAGRAPRYNEMAVKGGASLSDMTAAKDLRIASYLKQQNITPEAWMALEDEGRNAIAQKLGYKAFGKGGKLGRQTHAEGAKDVFDRLSDLWGRNE